MARSESPQRERMRSLFYIFKEDRDRVCAAYAEAEKAGEVPRLSDRNSTSPEAYAKALWRDGKRIRPGKTKGWLYH